ncbi:LysR family transcriptional regulator [Streptococcus pantholopis]|uniref:Transcriptional regulator n=1 Tax=Streptococcus pantholopis TaxID=1811193 RepID=A0A172Q7Z7_9STRE|nr:LysR family transcriptional regulator [Streptococcus pantholopis]AND79525.1 transcriptional regulator [Streptococcus pantholopis]
MNFEQLLYAEILSHYQSLQKAAEVLHISKSGLSLAISQLEDELGIKLFERTSLGTSLTPEGQKLLSSVSDILRAKNALENQAHFMASPDHFQKITIHYMNVMLRPFWEGFLQHYERDYQYTTFDISCHELPSIIRRLHHHEIDAGFIATNHMNQNELQGLEFRPVCHTKLVMLCSPKNPLLNKQDPITIEDIKKQRFSLFNDSLHDTLYDNLQNICGPLPLVLRTDDAWAMSQAILQLNTVCFGRIAQEQLSTNENIKDLGHIDIGHLIDDQFSLGWLINPNKKLSSQTEQLMDTITDIIKREAS